MWSCLDIETTSHQLSHSWIISESCTVCVRIICLIMFRGNSAPQQIALVIIIVAYDVFIYNGHSGHKRKSPVPHIFNHHIIIIIIISRSSSCSRSSLYHPVHIVIMGLRRLTVWLATCTNHMVCVERYLYMSVVHRSVLTIFQIVFHYLYISGEMQCLSQFNVSFMFTDVSFMLSTIWW